MFLSVTFWKDSSFFFFQLAVRTKHQDVAVYDWVIVYFIYEQHNLERKRAFVIHERERGVYGEILASCLLYAWLKNKKREFIVKIYSRYLTWVYNATSVLLKGRRCLGIAVVDFKTYLPCVSKWSTCINCTCWQTGNLYL